MKRAPQAIATVQVALFLMLAACAPSTPEPTVKTMSKADTKSVGDQHARTVMDLISGDHSREYNGEFYAPCEGRLGEFSKEVYTLRLSYYVNDVSPTEFATVFTRLRDQLPSKGYQVKRFDLDPKRPAATLVAENPKDGFEVSVEEVDPPTSLLVSVYSPCLNPPGGSEK